MKDAERTKLLEQLESGHLSNNEWLLWKPGKGWFRPNRQGYTYYTYFAGKYSNEEAWDYVKNNTGKYDDEVIFHHIDFARNYRYDFVDNVLWNMSDKILEYKIKNYKLKWQLNNIRKTIDHEIFIGNMKREE